MWAGLFVVSCIVLFVVPVIFVYHRVYDDGLVGRFGLVGLASMSGIVLLETLFGQGYGIAAEVSLLVASFALFMIWHLVRFHRRVLRNRRAEAAQASKVPAAPREVAR